MKYVPLLLSFGLLTAGCSSEPNEPLRPDPALTYEALQGLNVSRDTDEDADVITYVKCLDDYALKFDDDGFIAETFTETNDVDAVAYLTSLKSPERFKRFIDQVTAIDAKTPAQVFHYSYAEHCEGGRNSADCTLDTADANVLAAYMRVIQHGSNSCWPDD